MERKEKINIEKVSNSSQLFSTPQRQNDYERTKTSSSMFKKAMDTAFSLINWP
jgi:hypothetical protein